MRSPGPDIPAARAIHDHLISRGAHPTAPGFETGLSPCDGCYDAWVAGKAQYSAMWNGPRDAQQPRRPRPQHAAACIDDEGKVECICGLEDAEIEHAERQASMAPDDDDRSF